MPLTGEYDRFLLESSLGVISSPSSCIAFFSVNFAFAKPTISAPSSRELCAAAACERAIIYDIRTNQTVCVMRGCLEPCAVSSLCWLSERQSLAVGFANGAIHIYECGPEQFSQYTIHEQTKRDLSRSGHSLSAAESEDSDSGNGMVPPRCEFAGHRSAVLCLAYDESQMRLASGGLDTFIEIWDLVAECGIVRLAGHRGPITRLRFMPSSLLEDPDRDSLSTYNVLISSSKDSLIKCWDLVTNHCFHTFVASDKRSEVWDFVLVSNNSSDLVTAIDVGAPPARLPFTLISGSGPSGSSKPKAGIAGEDADEANQTGAAAGEQLRVCDVCIEPLRSQRVQLSAEPINSEANQTDFVEVGGLSRISRCRVSTLALDSTSTLVACHGPDKYVDVYKVLSPEEVSHRMLRKWHKARRRWRKQQASEASARAKPEENADHPPTKSDPHQQQQQPAPPGPDELDFLRRQVLCTLDDRVRHVLRLKCVAKVASVAFLEPPRDLSSRALNSTTSFKCALLLVNNSLEFYRIGPEKRASDAAKGAERVTANKKTGASDVESEWHAELYARLFRGGHRADPRTVAISSDGSLVLSCSRDTLKLWNRLTSDCKVTIPLSETQSDEYPTCALFLPSSRFALIGSKTGNCLVFDLHSSELASTIPIHDEFVLGLSLLPSKAGFLSCGKDKRVRQWRLDERLAPARAVELVPQREFTFDEDVLAACCAPDGRLLAASLLDSTVRIHYMDTGKHFLTLYGHKLPVLCLDISSDSRTIITGSADHCIKVWGLDFGDCHRSLLAHEDSVMAVQFIPNTENWFVSCSLDRTVKLWDGKRYRRFSTLSGHLGAVWCLAVSAKGDFVATASQDRSIRIWRHTDSLLVLEEEMERERDREYEQLQTRDRDYREFRATSNAVDNPPESSSAVEGAGEGAAAKAAKVPVVGEALGVGEASLPARRTEDAERGTERLVEAIDIAQQYIAETRLFREAKTGTLPQPDLHPLMRARRTSDPYRFVLLTLSSIRSGELERALLTLPFSKVTELLRFLDYFSSHMWEPELTTRCVLFLLKVNQNEIISSGGQFLFALLERLQASLPYLLGQIRDTIGMNRSALDYMRRLLEERSEVRVFSEQLKRAAEKVAKKRKQAAAARMRSLIEK